MKFNPKKKLAQLKRAAKRIPKIRTQADKEKFLERQAKRMDRNPTGPESVFEDILTSLKVKFETQKIINGKIYDFYVPDKNMLFEVDGSYWHGYGLKLEEMNDIQLKAYKNDLYKDAFAKGFGYLLTRIWEHELDDEHFEETKEKVRSLLK